MLADDRNGLGRSHVVAGYPVFLTRDAVEMFFDDLFAPRESVSSAHAEIMPDGRVSHYTVVYRQVCAVRSQSCRTIAETKLKLGGR